MNVLCPHTQMLVDFKGGVCMSKSVNICVQEVDNRPRGRGSRNLCRM